MVKIDPQPPPRLESDARVWLILQPIESPRDKVGQDLWVGPRFSTQILRVPRQLLDLQPGSLSAARKAGNGVADKGDCADERGAGV